MIDLQFAMAQSRDYHPPMRLPEFESPDRSLEDCAVCIYLPAGGERNLRVRRSGLG